VRYFTRGVVSGEFADSEVAEVKRSYAAHLRYISPRLPASVRLLTELSLRDGVIEEVVWESPVKCLRMSLVTPHSSGYRAMTFVYSGALLGARRIQTLRDVARDRETQILASEVDCDNEGLFSHSLLFWPRDELTIDFANLAVEETAERQDDRISLRPYFKEVFPEDSD
jgi:hypothetical protein